MTSSEPKMFLWIFCPQMTLHDIPKMSQIGVKISDRFSGPCIPTTPLKFGPTGSWILAARTLHPPLKIQTNSAVRVCLHPLLKIQTDSAARGSLHML